jgi:eukaryotic-like serine/threonine-protein kinase
LRGKYRIERTLGAGGMGKVLLATHLRLGQRVAIKILHATGLEKPEMVERFAREARAAAALTSDHVVRILDVDETEERVPFFVMEHLSGEDLEHVLAQGGPLPVGRAVDIVLDACEALAEAHACGIIHRDLKPANLFLTKRANGSELVKVLDFGISKAMTPEASIALTTTQTVMGSPLYMSPEQLRASRDVDGRSDVWSLGVVLFQLLTGRLPFTGTSATAVAACIAADPPAPLREARADVPEGLERIVIRCLEKRPADRIDSMVDVARALAPFGSIPNRADAVERAARTRADSDARGRQTETLPEVPSPAPEPARAPTKQEGSSTESSSVASFKPAPVPPRRRGVVIGVVVVAAVIVGATALRRGPSPSPSPSPSPAPSPSTAPSTAPAAVPPVGEPSAPVVTPAATPTAAPSASGRSRKPKASKTLPSDPLEVDIK